MSDSPRLDPDWVLALAAKAKDADGSPPFSDGALIEYRARARSLMAIDEVAAALVKETEAEFVVDPDARGRGVGTAMLEKLLAGGATLFWAHGDHPAARALAKSHGLAAVRELLHLRASVGRVAARSRRSETPVARTPVSIRPAGYSTNGFVQNHDEDEWVTLNALIFQNHPEQGSVTRQDLEQLETEPWFSAANFLLLRDGHRMIGYCWLKVEGDRGEFYVVGVHPDYRGMRLGSQLFDAGLARMRELGIRTAHLYVEGDNEAALVLYRSRGFEQDSIDIQYGSPPVSARG